VFQVLAVNTENDGGDSIRDCTRFLISDEQFADFCDRHKDLPFFVPESNTMMRSSYIILDEYLRFLNKGEAKYKESKSIIDVENIEELQELLEETDFEPDTFVARGGVYDWTKEGSCGSELDKNLQW